MGQRSFFISLIGWILTLVGCSFQPEAPIVSVLVKLNSDLATPHEELSRIASDYRGRASSEESGHLGNVFLINQPGSDTVLLVYLVKGECEFALKKVQQSLENNLSEADRVLIQASTFMECADNTAFFEQDSEQDSEQEFEQENEFHVIRLQEKKRR